jgi:hypothetical protein
MPFDNFVAEDALETMKMEADRIEQAALDAVEKHRGGKVVFTAHGGILRMLLIRLFGGAMAGFHRYPYLPNASITAFEIEDDGRVRLQQMGSTAHIPPELITAPTGRVPDWMWREHIWQALKGKQNGRIKSNPYRERSQWFWRSLNNRSYREEKQSHVHHRRRRGARVPGHDRRTVRYDTCKRLQDLLPGRRAGNGHR